MKITVIVPSPGAEEIVFALVVTGELGVGVGIGVGLEKGFVKISEVVSVSARELEAEAEGLRKGATETVIDNVAWLAKTREDVV